MKAFTTTPVVLLLSLLGVTADLVIELNNFFDNGTFEGYSDYYPFRLQYANIPPNFKGLLHEPEPSDGCSYIQPLSSQVLSNHSWIAVVSDYSACPGDMIINVRNAGYKLIVASSSADVHMNVDNSIRNSGFGVAIISKKYAETLRRFLISNVSDTVPDSAVLATVSGFVVASSAMVTSIFVALLFCCCWALCCCFLCRRGRRNQDLAGQVAEIEGRRRNFERVQRQERLARQELIESILRQLQEMQIDLRSQVPLGEDNTRKLPTRKYRSGEEKIERCAICVEDFVDGDILRVVPCGHSFHKECIDEWLINHSNVCPLCKFEVPRGDSDSPRLPQEGRPLIVDEDSSTSSEAIIPLIPHPAHQNSSTRTAVRQYGSV